jgi:predicted AlkP superfamily phosphohydrolase/phosphomutase
VSKTRAYALGINGIYINLRDREKRGWVSPHQVDAIKREIAEKLSKLRDPLNGQPIVTSAYDSQTIYSGPYINLAPDLVVGYHRGYRVSDESVLGKFPKELVRYRADKWAADHCIDPAVVPGILLCNRPCKHPKPGLWDMAPSILSLMGLPVPVQMQGRDIFS